MKVTFGILAIFFLGGCATIMRGSSEELQIVSVPSGATATVAGRTCSTPCSLPVERKETLVVEVKRAGCGSQKQTVLPTMGASFLFSGVPDYETGAAYHHEPNPVSFSLQCR